MVQTDMAQTDIVLVSMPWAGLNTPSLQLGLLKAAVERAGLSAVALHLNVTFFNDLAAAARRRGGPGFGPLDYMARCGPSPLSDLVFFVPPLLRTERAADLQALMDRVDPAGQPPAVVAEHRRALWARDRVPAFLDRAVAEILALQPRLVGFTCTLSQTTASILLARRLKEEAPDLTIVLGGADMAGVQGEACLRLFPWVDVVVRGDGERVLPELARSLTAGRRPDPAPGLCWREGGRIVAVPESAAMRVPPADLPLPDFTDYFARLDQGPLGAVAVRIASLPLESARGCSWGAARKCHFCGVSNDHLAHGRKTADQLAAEVEALAERHRILDIYLVDPLADVAVVIEALAGLRRRGVSATARLQTRPVLGREAMAALAAAGVKRVFLGIETLSTPLLEAMQKGVAAWQAVRSLKWAMQCGVQADWSFLWDIPGEDPAEYEKMALLIPHLHHLQPPDDTAPIHLSRSSGYFDRPEDFGIEIEEESSWLPLLYGAFASRPEDLTDLCKYFPWRRKDGRGAAAGIDACLEAVAAWRDAHSGPGARPTLTQRGGPGFVRIEDKRRPGAHRVFNLEGLDAQVYRACADGASAVDVSSTLDERTHGTLPLAAVEASLTRLAAAGLIFEDKGIHLALAAEA